VLTAGSEHQRQRAQNRARPVHGTGRDELTQTFLTQLTEIQHINERGEHVQPGMRDQRLARRGDQR